MKIEDLKNSFHTELGILWSNDKNAFIAYCNFKALEANANNSASIATQIHQVYMCAESIKSDITTMREISVGLKRKFSL